MGGGQPRLGGAARPWGLAAGRPCLGSDRRGQDRDPGDPSASPAFRRELSWVRTWKEEARTLLPAEPGPHASALCTPARSTSCEPPGQMSWPMDAHNVSIPFSIRGGRGGSAESVPSNSMCNGSGRPGPPLGRAGHRAPTPVSMRLHTAAPLEACTVMTNSRELGTGSHTRATRCSP